MSQMVEICPHISQWPIYCMYCQYHGKKTVPADGLAPLIARVIASLCTICIDEGLILESLIYHWLYGKLWCPPTQLCWRYHCFPLRQWQWYISIIWELQGYSGNFTSIWIFFEIDFKRCPYSFIHSQGRSSLKLQNHSCERIRISMDSWNRIEFLIESWNGLIKLQFWLSHCLIQCWWWFHSHVLVIVMRLTGSVNSWFTNMV